MSEHIKDFDAAADVAIIPEEAGRPEENQISRAIRACMVGGAVMAVLNGCGAEMEGEADFGEVSQAVTNYGNITIPISTYGVGMFRTFNKVAGHRYTACINPTSGVPDLYGHYTGNPSPSNNQFKSKNVSGPDCIWFTANSSGPYYLGLYSFPSSIPSSASLWLTDAPLKVVPSGFSKALTWPLPGRTSLSDNNTGTNNYSEFGSPWGNASVGNAPFFSGALNGIHSGVDIAAPPNTTVVKAACDGKIVKTGVLDGAKPSKWGYYVVQECTKSGKTISVGYDHLNDKGRPAVSSTIVTAGTAIGTIYDMNVPGENDHLHLGICNDAHANCHVYDSNGKHTGQLPQLGYIPKDVFPGKAINPWITTNPGIY